MRHFNPLSSVYAQSYLFCFVFQSTPPFISREKLVSLKVFPLMYFKCSIFPLAVSCTPWQLTLSPLCWIQCYSPAAVGSHRPDRQLPGKRLLWVQTEPTGLSVTVNPHTVCDFPNIPSAQIQSLTQSADNTYSDPSAYCGMPFHRL